MKYVPPFGVSDPNASYVNGNPATGTAGSIPRARTFEDVQREVLEVITHAGLAPNENDLTQLRQAIQQMISDVAYPSGGDPPPGGGGAYLPLAGGLMDNNADAVFRGTGDPMKSGKPYWHPDNDGADSGLDADLLGGVGHAKFVRNDTDNEAIAQGRVRAQRISALANLGRLLLQGRDAAQGGGQIAFANGAGDIISALLALAADRRTMPFQMWSDGGTATFEDQIRVQDDGDIWLRKPNKTVTDLLAQGRIIAWTVVGGATPPAFNVTQINPVSWRPTTFRADRAHEIELRTNSGAGGAPLYWGAGVQRFDTFLAGGYAPAGVTPTVQGSSGNDMIIWRELPAD